MDNYAKYIKKALVITIYKLKKKVNTKKYSRTL